jgi:cysteine-rich repeat protein
MRQAAFLIAFAAGCQFDLPHVPAVPGCGDRVLDLGEECDDGNLVDGDGCDSDCTITGCGNGIPTTGEACDDGNAANNDGCSSTCTVESATPSLAATIDKSTISTELRTTHMLTVSLTASGGFTGPATLAASVADGTGTAIPGWTVAFDKTSVDVTSGTGQAIATVTVPSTNKGLVGTVKIDVTGTGVPAKQVTSTVTAVNQITIPITVSGGQCVYPAAGTIQVTLGTKIRWLNKSTQNITIHVNGGDNNGVPHQPDPGSAPNTAYEPTLSGTAVGAISWYCHAPGPTVNGLVIQPVAP